VPSRGGEERDESRALLLSRPHRWPALRIFWSAHRGLRVSVSASSFFINHCKHIDSWDRCGLQFPLKLFEKLPTLARHVSMQ
jgi:hypothetical protein